MKVIVLNNESKEIFTGFELSESYIKGECESPEWLEQAIQAGTVIRNEDGTMTFNTTDGQKHILKSGDFIIYSEEDGICFSKEGETGE